MTITDQSNRRVGQASRLPKCRPIGPFFVAALIISAGLFFWQTHQNARWLAGLPPPVVEHQIIGATNLAEAAVPPPDFVHRQAEALGLTATQRQSLAPVVAAYQRELAPLQHQMDSAVARFEQYRQAQADRKRVKVEDLQHQMAEIGALSGRMAALRQSYWARTEPLLSSSQQAAAKKLWARSLTANNRMKGPQS